VILRAKYHRFRVSERFIAQGLTVHVLLTLTCYRSNGYNTVRQVISRSTIYLFPSHTPNWPSGAFVCIFPLQYSYLSQFKATQYFRGRRSVNGHTKSGGRTPNDTGQSPVLAWPNSTGIWSENSQPPRQTDDPSESTYTPNSEGSAFKVLPFGIVYLSCWSYVSVSVCMYVALRYFYAQKTH